MINSRSTLSQVVDASVRAIYDQGRFDLGTMLYGPSLGFTEYSPDVPDEKISTISGPGPGKLTVEGQQYGSNDLYKGYPVTLVMNKFTSELRWTEEALHWLNKQSSSKRVTTFTSIVKHAINALNYNLNTEAAKLFYLGFGTTNLTGGDGLALFSSSHTIRRTGGTQSNMFPTANGHLPFSAANLVTAVTIMNRFVGMNNIQMLPVRRIRVLCSNELQPTVEQAINSLYGPINANLGLSTASKEAFRSRSVDIESKVIWDQPTAYSTYWYVVDLDRAAELAWLAVGWMPRMADETIVQKGQYVNETSTFFGYVFSGWQWVFGSKGDNSSSA